MPVALPAVTFESAPPPLELTLPRMDVAAFVGLTSTGPIGVPVACEDVARFRAVFGPDLVLGRDGRTGQQRTGHLGAAVESFFANGGRRCLVLRVARTADEPGYAATAGEAAAPGAVRAAWPLPGVVTRAGEQVTLAQGRAVAAGGWADQLRLSLALHRRSLAAGLRLGPQRDDARGDWVVPARWDLGAGDLLELDLGTLVLHAVIDRVTPADTVAGEGTAGARAVAVIRAADRRWWRRPEHAPVPDDLQLVTPTGPQALQASLRVLSTDDARYRVQDLEGEPLSTGDLLRIQTPEGTGYAPVVIRDGDAIVGPVSIPVAEAAFVRLAAREQPAHLARLTLSARLLSGDGAVATLAAGGLDARHPAGLPGLPLDEERYLDPEASVTPFPVVCSREPRPAPFPSPRIHPAVEAQTLLPLLPAGVWTMPVPPLQDGPGAPLAREGLLPLDASIFVDRRHQGSTIDTLRRVADQHRAAGAQDLRGVHRLLSLGEATLAAIPDATQVGWERRDGEAPTPLPAPDLALPKEDGQHLVLQWDEVPGATSFRLEVLPTRDAELPTSARTLPRSDREARVPLSECSGDEAYRIRALRDDQPGPASATRLAVAPAGDFDDDRQVDHAPVLHIPASAVAGQPVEVRWLAPRDGARHFEVQVGGDPLMAAARTRVIDSAAQRPDIRTTVDAIGETRVYVTLTTPAGRVTWLRVRALSATPDAPPGPWSATQPIVPAAVDELRFDSARQASDLESVQRALLRVAAARGDVLAVLHLPSDARPRDATDRIERLSSDEAADSDDVRALGHGAAYHPWLRVDRGAAHPPDGAACGVLAATALDPGAWAAPANRPLRDALAVDPTGIDPVALLAARVNPLAASVRGITALTARTLTPLIGDIDRIGPRRLMMLLRRLAEREGAAYTFAPNGRDLQAAIRTTFTRVLTDLFVRGALAGATPDQAFQVMVPSTAGGEERVVVELRVAPSHPLEFLVVRLHQRGAGRIVVEAVQP